MKKILSVDDSIPALVLVRELLRDEYEVFTATSGKEALAFLEGERPDAILMDFYMPDMDGVETLEEMCKIEGFDIPVIMISSVSTKPLEERYHELGAAAVLPKPFKPDELKECLTRVLSGK